MAEITQKLVDGAGLQTAMGIMGDYAENRDRGVVGGFNQSFPLTNATKGNIYYHKSTNRYYICIENYNGSSLTNPNSQFEELSIYTNRQRLDNLFTLGKQKFKIRLDKNPKVIPTGLYLAVNGHLGYKDLATVQLFNVTSYHGENSENNFYKAVLLYPSTPTIFQIYYNPYTCEIRIDSNSVYDKEFILYNIDETLGN